MLSKAPEFRNYEVRRSIESAERYVLLIHWASLEDHTVGFRNSPAYGKWRAIVRPFLRSRRWWSTLSSAGVQRGGRMKNAQGASEDPRITPV
ncbi:MULTISPECIES: antibiotic biosynthesis monooxygenase family protein [unclassified Variovorax]|uniref:antibiotic biosynthesis monooxygenase family protein n=1 Tax=unclassified Variovorax TaxID=663243 RepID=UPI003F50E6B8